MTLAELVELLTDELGLDLSSDSDDGALRVYVMAADETRLRPILSGELDQDGDVILMVGA